MMKKTKKTKTSKFRKHRFSESPDFEFLDFERRTRMDAFSVRDLGLLPSELKVICK